ncbi:cytochrome c1 [Bartonella sp. B23]
MAFHDLKALGYDQEQIKDFAKRYEVRDGYHREENFSNALVLQKTPFFFPFVTKKKPKFVLNGAYPLELSLIALARVISLPFLAVIFDVLTLLIL